MAFNIIPYLNFDGKAEEAFELYQKAFNGKIQLKQKFSDTPYGDQLSELEKNIIMHMPTEIAPGYSLMASDILPSAGHTFQKGNNHHIS